MKSRQFLSMVIVLPALALSVDAAENTTIHTATPIAQHVPPHPTPCSSYTKELLLDNKLALASLWANLSNSDQSMKSTIAKALDVADKGHTQASMPMDLCPDSCQLPPQPEIVLRSTPHHYLDNYEDKTKCEAYYQHTLKEPIRFHNKRFRSTTELNHWFSDFSQGRGQEGADLYQRCDGLCSPSYTTFIRKEAQQYHVTVEVVCGPARDKHDNRYEITLKYLWVCQDRTAPSP